MQILWAPWRLKYILKSGKEKGCIFCQKPRENKDRDNYILLRGENCFVILNAFPYNNGHLLIVPYRHISSVEELNPEESKELMELTGKMVAVLRKVMRPDGFNIGINLGRAAGAGIEDHLHIHIVPRWVGDCNFMPVLSETKVIPEALDKTYEKLKREV
ncbi:HIT domain-containing protein [Candidatus Aerophobetes bacterium]|nr:HIT domain-containing protein [Candidatus Aerophobetes bacterium]